MRTAVRIPALLVFSFPDTESRTSDNNRVKLFVGP